MLRLISACILFLSASSFAQTVQPVISEYKEKASGQLALTNNTLEPMVVVLEPKSFSITPEGKGIFRPLDPDIHVTLSAQSVRLEPQQTYHVFYKADADHYPQWFTIYAAFSPIRKGPSLQVRILLPHTVYLYQKQPAPESSVTVSAPTYNVQTRTFTCDVQDSGEALTRVLGVHVGGEHSSVDGSGFPLLPHSTRHLEIPWTEKEEPTTLKLELEHFSLTRPISLVHDK